MDDPLLRVPRVPLDNNMTERLLKVPILYVFFVTPT